MAVGSNKPTLLFDGDCSFCRTWVERWRKSVGKAVKFRSYQEAHNDFPQVSEADCRQSVQLIHEDGSVESGAGAVFSVLERGGESGWRWTYDHIPGFRALSESFYSLVAGHRSAAYSAMGFFSFGAAGSSYVFSSWLFLKLLGVVYLIAFISFGVQAFGLIGKDGILPVSEYMARVKATLADSWISQVPSLFGISGGDWMIQLVIVAGIVFSLLLIAGLAPRISLIALFVLYLSVVNGGQVFFSFQWDILLLEAGFLAIFLTPSSNLMIWIFWWLLAKVILMSGAVKLMSGDTTWRDLSALSHHFQTQPIPNLGGYLAHQLPAWIHKLGTFGVLSLEFITVVLLGLWRNARLAGAFGIILLQVAIALTGNYTFFNILTVGIALLVIDNALWSTLLPTSWVDSVTAGVQSVGLGWPVGGVGTLLPASAAVWFGWLAVGVGVAYLVLSGFQAARMFTRLEPPQFIQQSLQTVRPFRVTNTYGLFASMTTDRPEITVEGSHDGKTWQQYHFKYKPNGPMDRPPQVAPHQPRLDWQMWFAALRRQPPPWFQAFTARLLENSSAVTKLLEYNPFITDNPPRYIRARVENYEFTNFRELINSGRWWQVGKSRPYMSAVSVDNFRR